MCRGNGSAESDRLRPPTLDVSDLSDGELTETARIKLGSTGLPGSKYTRELIRFPLSNEHGLGGPNDVTHY
mgnify:CR=1 FL=1